MDIRTYAEGNQEVSKLLGEAIDIFANGESFHDHMSRQAHMMGLQGAKRYHKLQSNEDRCRRIEVQHYAIDIFSENISPKWYYEPPTPLTYKDMLEIYLTWEMSVYKRINGIANDLYNINMNNEGKIVSNCIDGVVKEIEKIRRKLLDYEKVNWSWSYIKIKDSELHDKIKKNEK